MKNQVVLMVIALFAFTFTNAQDVKFGAKAGLNLASVTGDDADGFDGKASIHFGGVVNIGVSDIFAIQPEVLYSRQGFEDGAADVKAFLDYLNIPIMADVTVADGFSLQGGPQIGINLNAIVKDNQTDNEVDIDTIESLDIAGAIGAQYKLPVGVFFQARYTVGVTDIIEDFSAKNSVVSLSVGYFFN